MKHQTKKKTKYAHQKLIVRKVGKKGSKKRSHSKKTVTTTATLIKSKLKEMTSSKRGMMMTQSDKQQSGLLSKHNILVKLKSKNPASNPGDTQRRLNVASTSKRRRDV